MKSMQLLSVHKDVSARTKVILVASSFLLPFVLWTIISYVPFIWHPFYRITSTGDVSRYQEGMYVKKKEFLREQKQLIQKGKNAPEGILSNPIFLPAPHAVAVSFYKAFTTEPRRSGEPWLHESLLTSIRVIFWGFFLSSLIGVPLGIFCGTYRWVQHLFEPFIEFFRYLPAPAFGALAVAVLGIHQAPKIAIIFIGTFFQQVLVISATTQRLDRSLVEAAQTLGTRGGKLLTRVVIPGILPDLYRDMRILLGWAWTYLIVSEVVGTSTGITWFINQQAKYRIYDNVYAAIFMIGIIGLVTDMILAWIGHQLFPWKNMKESWFKRVFQKDKYNLEEAVMPEEKKLTKTGV